MQNKKSFKKRIKKRCLFTEKIDKNIKGLALKKKEVYLNLKGLGLKKTLLFLAAFIFIRMKYCYNKF
jgi:hypothetical protein